RRHRRQPGDHIRPPLVPRARRHTSDRARAVAPPAPLAGRKRKTTMTNDPRKLSRVILDGEGSRRVTAAGSAMGSDALTDTRSELRSLTLYPAELRAPGAGSGTRQRTTLPPTVDCAFQPRFDTQT